MKSIVVLGVALVASVGAMATQAVPAQAHMSISCLSAILAYYTLVASDYASIAAGADDAEQERGKRNVDLALNDVFNECTTGAR